MDRIWDPNRAYIGHIKYLAQNIDEKDQLDFSTKVGLLGTPCCEMMGIALNNSSFIGNRYLKHFMKYNDVYWGDIGVDFAVRENKIYVNNVRKSGQFLINDEIISVDGTLVKDIRKLNEKILFADRGSTLYFQVLRDNVDLNISTEVFAKDLSKFNLPSNKPKPKPTNFRSNIGLSVNSSLIVTKVDAGSKAALAGFMVGDKILRANNVTLKDFKELQTLLGTGNDFNILIERKSDKLPLLGLNNDLGGVHSGGDGKISIFHKAYKVKELFIKHLENHLPKVQSFHPFFNEALAKMLKAGGKHFRAQLLLGVVQNKAPHLIPNALNAALALEFIHTYSLIHDDLPAMDNADLRRGTPTLHKSYDETTAILVGDALNTEAFLLLSNLNLKESIKINLIRTLAFNAGINGMILGQAIDCYFEDKKLNLEELEFLHT